VNHGTQARKDIGVMRPQVAETKDMLLKTSQDQQQQITEIKNLVLFQMKEKKIDKAEVKRLLKELNEKDKKIRITEQVVIYSRVFPHFYRSIFLHCRAF